MVENVPTTVGKGRITRQGIRDLNYYGPRRKKGVAEAPQAATLAVEGAVAEAPPSVTPAAGSPDGRGIE